MRREDKKKLNGAYKIRGASRPAKKGLNTVCWGLKLNFYLVI